MISLSHCFIIDDNLLARYCFSRVHRQWQGQVIKILEIVLCHSLVIEKKKVILFGGESMMLLRGDGGLWDYKSRCVLLHILLLANHRLRLTRQIVVLLLNSSKSGKIVIFIKLDISSCFLVFHLFVEVWNNLGLFVDFAAPTATRQRCDKVSFWINHR